MIVILGFAVMSMAEVLITVVAFRKIGLLEETITIASVLKRRNVTTLCLPVNLLNKQLNMHGNWR
jgi:hypothetical protein